MANRRIHDLEDTATTLDSGAYIAVDSDSYTAAKKFAADSLQTAVDIGGLTPTDGNFIVGNGSAWVAESGATARTSLGLGTMATEATTSYLAVTGATTGATSQAQTFTNGVNLGSGAGYQINSANALSLPGGANNVAVGAGALRQVSSGTNNLAVGASSMDSLTAGNYNAGVGSLSLYFTTGSHNIGVGWQALAQVTSGSGNTGIGSNAGPGSGSGTLNYTASLGYYAKATKDYQCIIGGSDGGYTGVDELAVFSNASGGAFVGQAASSTTFGVEVAKMAWSWNVSTHASREGDLTLSAIDYGGTREGLRIRANGTAAAIGFLGATPAVRQTHIADPSGGGTQDAEARTAINSILSVLETFGLVATS